MVDEEHDEHIDFPTKENNFISLNNNCLFLTIVPLLKVKKIERFRMKICLEEGEAIIAVITSLRECFFNDAVFT